MPTPKTARQMPTHGALLFPVGTDGSVEGMAVTMRTGTYVVGDGGAFRRTTGTRRTKAEKKAAKRARPRA